MFVNVARVISRSRANGPGERYVIWVQGCALACHGCWNPDTWSFAPKSLQSVGSLMADIRRTAGIEGVTFSGGEPFAQAPALSGIAREVRASGLSVVIFTGYEIVELSGPVHQSLLGNADVVVAGRYEAALRTTSHPWRGSTNQRVHFLSNRYSEADQVDSAASEVQILVDGTMLWTGFPEDGLLADDSIDR